jgi:chemosensory pili system protein ChpA (sensor histidine kinase/response regulator)
MDHGPESARERLDAGNDAKGRLVIIMKRQDENLVLRYSDDGRGLNLTRIAEVGLRPEHTGPARVAGSG